MERVLKVKNGAWQDYHQGFFTSHVWTVTTSTNSLLQLATGILFAAASPYLSRILIRALYEWPHAWLSRRRDQRNVQDGPSSERSRLLGADPDPPSPDGNGTTPVEALEAVKGEPSSYVTVALILAVMASVGYSIAGSFSAVLPVGSSVLSQSEVCGSWHLKDNAGPQKEIRDALFQAQKEHRSGEYARDCYRNDNVLSSDHCAFFENQTLTYKVEAGKDCGFPDTSFCHNGPYSAVQFSTGHIDANFIGINAAKRPKLSRTTRCEALNMSQGFIKTVDEKQALFEYHLGPKKDSDYQSKLTFRQSGDPFKWDLAGYSVNAYEATSDPATSYWTPISGLGHPPDTHMTVIFISSCHLFYRGYSTDPIFPADLPVKQLDNSWLNSDPRARPVVCTDWSEVCSHDGRCAPASEQHPEHGVLYEFTRLALRSSTAFDAIKYRLGDALLAQHRIADYDSEQLPHNHWIHETEALFRTSLARIQYNALDIAIGLGNRRGDEYEEDTPEFARSKLCGFYKFRVPQGHANINIWATVGILLMAAMIAILGLETPQPLPANRRRSFFQSHFLVFDLSVLTICRAVTGDFGLFSDFAGWLQEIVKSYWEALTKPFIWIGRIVSEKFRRLFMSKPVCHSLQPMTSGNA